MSHFSCAVITDGTKTVEELLAPYQENNMETVPREYLAFVDETDEYRSEYEEKSFLYYRDPNDEQNTLRWSYDDAFKKDGRHVAPDGCAEVRIPCGLVYPTFEQYMLEYVGKEPNDDGRYGFWENPNARWDWYSELVSPCWADDELGHTPVRLSDIMFDPERSATEARKFIQAHPCGGDGVHGLERYFVMRDMTDEQYVEAQRHLSFWACVTPDGEWHEVATMGWFGMADTTPNGYYDWQVHFRERFIDPWDSDCVLHVVNCHI